MARVDGHDIDLQYHPGKINVVPDALSRKLEAFMAMQITQQNELFEVIRRTDLMMIRRAIAPDQLMAMQIQPTFFEKIREAQSGDLKLQEFW